MHVVQPDNAANEIADNEIADKSAYDRTSFLYKIPDETADQFANCYRANDRSAYKPE